MYIFITLVFILLTGCNKADDYIQTSMQLSEQGAYATAIANDNSIAIVSGINSGIVVWDLVNKQPKYHWSHRAKDANVVMDISIGFDSNYAVTADRRAFVLWDLRSGEPEGFWRIDHSSIRDTAVANDGRAVLIGRGNGQVLFFEPDTGRRLEFLGHSEKINSVDISPNGRYALTGGNDYTAHLWNTDSGQVIYTFNHPSRVTKVKLDPQGRYAFTADSQKMARIWDLSNGKVVSALDYMARQKIFTTVRFSADGSLLATGSPSRNVTVWDVASGQAKAYWSVTANPRSRYASAIVHDVSFDLQNHINTASSSGVLEHWDYQNKQP